MAFPGTQQIPIAFSGGLNSKVSAFSLDQPYLLRADNVRYNLQGQIDKRPGFTALTRNVVGGRTLANGEALATFRDELLLFDGEQVYSWQPEQAAWLAKGFAFSAIAGQQRVLNTKVATQANPDADTMGGFTVYAWEDNRTEPAVAAGVRYSVVNNVTGSLVISDVLIYPYGARPKVVSLGASIWLVYCASSDTILLNAISETAPAILTPAIVVLTDGLSSTPGELAIPFDVSYPAGIAYASTTGLRLNGTIVDASTTIQCIALTQDSLGNTWVAWSDEANTYVRAFTGTSPLSPKVTIQAQPSVNLAILEHTSPGSLNVTCEVAFTYGNYLNNYTVSATGVGAYVGQQRSLGLASKPFAYDGNIFVAGIYPSSLQATYFTLCLTAPVGSGNNPESGQPGAAGFVAVAKHAAGNGGTYRTNALMSECHAQTAAAFLFAGQRKGPFTSFDNAQTVNLGVAGYSTAFETTNNFNSVEANNNLHIVGGVKRIYDGVSCVEDNFHVFPELLANGQGAYATLIPSIGGLSPNAQYQACVTYEWTDNAGQVQRSGPSVAVMFSTDGTGTQAVQFNMPTLRITEKNAARSPVSVCVYMTQGNLPIFYKITDDNAPVVNDVLSDLTQFTFTGSDASIAANENLYTGSQLANTAPPSCSLIALYQNRVMVNADEDANVLWYSQNKFDLSQYNTLPLDFNTSFVEGVDSRGGGGITAIGLLDASEAIFKETSVFILQGAGPNALGTTGEFNDAQLLVSDTGCTNQNSLVFVTQTPNLPGGLLFKSAKGIYLLGRDQSLYYIGAPVEQYNGLTITGACLLAKTNEVAFTTLEGTILVYNYFFNAWSAWTNLPSIDAVMWNDQLVILREDGTAQMQDDTGTVWADTSSGGTITPVNRIVGLPWLPLSGMQGFLAVYNATLLGQYNAPSVLKVDVAYDYNPSIVESVLLNSSLAGNHWGSLPIWGNPGGTWASPQFANYQFQINFKNPRCQAISLTLTDMTPEPGPGSTLNGLVIEVLRLSGGMRLPTGNLVGTRGYNK